MPFKISVNLNCVNYRFLSLVAYKIRKKKAFQKISKLHETKNQYSPPPTKCFLIRLDISLKEHGTKVRVRKKAMRNSDWLKKIRSQSECSKK